MCRLLSIADSIFVLTALNLLLTLVSCFVIPHGDSTAMENTEAMFPHRGVEDEDDMILTKEQVQDFMGPQRGDPRSGLKHLKYRWPNGTVYYEIDSKFSSNERKVIHEAMEHIMTRTCIAFRPKHGDTKDYVHISKDKSGCSAHVGRIGGKQTLNLGSGCVYRYIVAHELTHAIGFWHEQCRTDRDDYVSINWDNIPSNRRHNFNKFSAAVVDPYGSGYDYNSLMHYGGYDFAINRSQPTILPTNALIRPTQLGNRHGLTQWDADKINNMYKDICP